MEEILHNLICGMATEAVMGFVQDKKHNLVHVHEAVDQCIPEHPTSGDDKVDVPRAHTFRSPDRTR